MKTKRTTFHSRNRVILILTTLLLIVSGTLSTFAATVSVPDSTQYVKYRGTIIDAESRRPLGFATLTLEGSNLSTVANSEGEFIFKVPITHKGGQVIVNFLGHKERIISLSSLKPDKNKIEMELQTVTLSTISVHPKDPDMLMSAILGRRGDNYNTEQDKIVVFYRESIKKNRSYVSLSEAVLDVYKQPILSFRMDLAELSKGRKSTDYSKLDTVTFKLQGGPYTSLMLDIMKNPEEIFTDEMIKNYEFEIENISKVGDRLMYVIDFKQKPEIKEPLYFGKLYVDTESLAVLSATFSLNVSDKGAAADLFIRKKPLGARVYPTEANYQVNYREKDGKWVFGYSRAEIVFKVDWKRRLFNTYYTSTIEMAVTDWVKSPVKNAKPNERLRSNVVMMDEVSGFGDPDFWGVYNLIEPEKPIEQAIRKIQKKLSHN
ncbi:MAG: carboxypeptidase-like regulatory domain-containing protein [Marinilabiliales bacterium]|nr:carboxypeptidase-like regulatory domain-containing protein [Marinilabiliales bacterium]